MKKLLFLRSRRSLFTRGSLGVVGALGITGATSLLDRSASAVARVDTLDPIVGVWDTTSTLQTLLGISLPALPAQINGRIIFNEDGTLVADSDVDALPLVGGPSVLGYWAKTAVGYAFSGKRPLLTGALVKAAGTLIAEGTFTLNGNTFTGTSTLKLPAVPELLTYTITATRFGPQALS